METSFLKRLTILHRSGDGSPEQIGKTELFRKMVDRMV